MASVYRIGGSGWMGGRCLVERSGKGNKGVCLFCALQLVLVCWCWLWLRVDRRPFEKSGGNRDFNEGIITYFGAPYPSSIFVTFC